MSMELISNAGLGAIEFRNAMDRANQSKNALFRSYGFTAPGAGGAYDIQSAQAAFDPNTLFDKATGGIDEARVAELAGSLRTGTTGVFSDISRAGAAQEAEAMAQTRAAGIGGGGLAAQRARLAEAQTAQQQTGARQEFLGQLGQAFAPIGESYQRMEMQRIQDEAARLGAEAGSASTPDYGLPMEDEAPFEEEVEISEETGTPPTRPTVKDIRSKPEGSKLSAGAAGEFNTLLKSNQGNLANLKGMLKKWDLTPAQRTAVERQIRAATNARKGVEKKPVARPQTRPAQRPQAQRQPQRQARPAPAPKPKPKPRPKKKK